MKSNSERVATLMHMTGPRRKRTIAVTAVAGTLAEIVVVFVVAVAVIIGEP